MRKVFCLGLVVVIALMMTLPVFASGSSFEFVAQHPIQTLPSFEPSETHNGVFCCDEFVPAGLYRVSCTFASDSSVVELDDLIEVSFGPLADFPGFLGCDVTSTAFYMGRFLTFRLVVLYNFEAEQMQLIVSLGSQILSGSLGDIVLFDPVSADDSSQALSDSLVALFGPYEPQMETVTEVLSDGSSVTYERVIPDVAGLDYEWIASVGLFALILFCFFRIVGGALKQ